jgi:hypothetical protein
MLKHTVSADGRVMPADRRTVLRSMLTVGAIGAKPIAVGASIAAEPAGEMEIVTIRRIWERPLAGFAIWGSNPRPSAECPPSGGRFITTKRARSKLKLDQYRAGLAQRAALVDGCAAGGVTVGGRQDRLIPSAVE